MFLRSTNITIATYWQSVSTCLLQDFVLIIVLLSCLYCEIILIINRSCIHSTVNILNIVKTSDSQQTRNSSIRVCTHTNEQSSRFCTSCVCMYSVYYLHTLLQDNSGRTPLSYAASSGQTKSLMLLLEAGSYNYHSVMGCILEKYNST